MTRCIPRRAWLLIVLTGLLTGCTQADLAPVGAITLSQFADDHLSDAIFSSGYVLLDTRADPKGTSQDDRIPEWAEGSYSACVYWEDRFKAFNRNGDSQRGKAWGWVLVDSELQAQVMELSYQLNGSDEVVTLVDRWDAPAED